MTISKFFSSVLSFPFYFFLLFLTPIFIIAASSSGHSSTTNDNTKSKGKQHNGSTGPNNNHSGARCLIISIDNRHLKTDYHAKDYTSMTSVITHAYADYHHYDYLYLQNNITYLENEVSRLFNNIVIDPNMDRHAVAKDLATAMHIGYLEYRAASWAKLPVLWYIAATFQDMYDYVWYIDSDATISPLQLSRSIEDSIALWSSNPEEIFPKIIQDLQGKGKGSTSGTFVGHSEIKIKDEYKVEKVEKEQQTDGEKATTTTTTNKRVRIKFNQYNQKKKSAATTSTNNFVRFGQKDLKKAHFIFFNNFPWRDNMPCAGSFIFRPTKLAERIFRQWWDFYLPMKNFKHFHEQDALWHMIESEYWIEIYRQRHDGSGSQGSQTSSSLLEINENSPGWKTVDSPEAKEWLEMANYKPLYLLNSSTYAIVTEEQFPSAFTRYEDLWLTHIASYNYQLRMPILYHFLRVLHIDEITYVTKVNHVNSLTHTKVLQPLILCLEMERRSKMEDELFHKQSESHSASPVDVAATGKGSNLDRSGKTSVQLAAMLKTITTPQHQHNQEKMKTWKAEAYERIRIWPKHNEIKQHEWYDDHVTSTHSIALSPAELHEGQLVRRKGEFWMIQDGKKRGFENFQAFLALGLYDDVAIHLRPDEVHAIPDGTLITLQSISLPKNPSATPLSPVEIERIEREKFNLLKQYQLVNKVSLGGRQPDSFEEAVLHGMIPGVTSLTSTSSTAGTGSGSQQSISTTVTKHHSHTQAYQCTRDEELEKLIVTKGTRAKLIIISHSDESEKLVQDFIACQTQGMDPGSEGIDKDAGADAGAGAWIQSLRITSTVYFESILYALLNASTLSTSSTTVSSSAATCGIEKEKIASLLTLSYSASSSPSTATSTPALPTVLPSYTESSSDYLITATYKTITKQLHYNGFTQSMSMISTYLQLAAQEQFDVIPFLRSGSKMMEFATYFHGSNFQIAWDKLLLAMGYSLKEIRSFDNEKVVFYRNIFLIKSNVFSGLACFMTKAMWIAKENEEVSKALAMDAKYKEGSLEVAKRIFGTSYYQLHPFVFERLPSFYLFITKAKICTGSSGPCKYNS